MNGRAWLLSTMILVGCDPAIESATESPAASIQPFDVVASDVIRTRLQVTPTVLSPGDTALLSAASTNSGADTVSARSGCAPGLGFRIRRPDGTVIDPYSGLAFDCPRLDSQDLMPGETDTVSWSWAAPDIEGRYEVIGGLLVDGRIEGPSAPVTLEVR